MSGAFEVLQDRDAFRVELVGGTEYKFTIGGCRNGGFAGIYDSNGTLVQNSEGSLYTGRTETFTPGSTGTYVVVAKTDGSSFPQDMCDYTIRLREVA